MSKERKIKPQEPTKIVYTEAAEAKKVAKAGTEEVVHAALAEKLIKKGFAKLASDDKKSSKNEEK